MALLRPRQFGSNTQNPHSQPSQITQPGLPTSMTFPTSFTPPPDGFLTLSQTSPSTSKATSKSTTSGRSESSSTQAQSSGSTPSSNLSSTNTPPTVASAGDSSGYGSSTTTNSGNALSPTSLPASATLGGVGASASSSSRFSASTTSAGILTGTEVKCTSLSCNPGKAAAIFVPIAIVFALLAICIAFCVRRNGRARLGQGLAFFSHGAETNYVSASASSAGNSRAPSMREADSSYGPLAAGAGLGAAGAAGLAAARGNRQNHDHDFGLGFVPDTLSRSSSEAHCAAPPPYAPRQSNEMNHNAVEPADITRHSPLAAPAAAHTTSDPFADTPNPFTDDAAENASLLSGDTAVNRGIGSRRSVRDNASIVSSLRDMDEAGSIRDAQVANVSRGPSLSTGTGGRSRPRALS